MTRIKIPIPEICVYRTSVKLRITDINYGGHLANDAVLGIAHEARIQFLAGLGYSEKSIEDKGIIMTDAGIVYKSQGYHGDEINIDLYVDEINRMGFDLIYTLQNKSSQKELARVKTGITFFDYKTNKITSIPDAFKIRLLDLISKQ